MEDRRMRPFTTAELIDLDDRSYLEGGQARPWGYVAEHAFAFYSSKPISVERAKVDGGYVLRSSAAILPGLPVIGEEQARGETITRSAAEREGVVPGRAVRQGTKVRQERHQGKRRGGKRQALSADGHRPAGLPIAYLPRILRDIGEERYGLSASGGRVLLATTVVQTWDGKKHSTIIDGESRDFLRPTDFPYTAVCKLEKWRLDTGSGSWVNSGSYASGFLIGRKTLLTSGHAWAGDSLASGNFAIKVIPACWANTSVFGPGAITWVRQRKYWHSDSGNDLQVCQLYDPIGDQMGYFGARVYDSDWEDLGVWTMAGFPYDRSMYGMSVQHGIHVRDDDDGDDIRLDGDTYDTTQVENDADEASGASGSPLFAWFGDDNPCAVGVHAGYETDWTAGGDETWSCAAGGDGFVAIVNWARANWES